MYLQSFVVFYIEVQQYRMFNFEYLFKFKSISQALFSGIKYSKTSLMVVCQFTLWL